jgi:hypothetical protein
MEKNWQKKAAKIATLSMVIELLKGSVLSTISLSPSFD